MITKLGKLYVLPGFSASPLPGDFGEWTLCKCKSNSLPVSPKKEKGVD